MNCKYDVVFIDGGFPCKGTTKLRRKNGQGLRGKHSSLRTHLTRIFLLAAAATSTQIIHAWEYVVSDEPTLLDLNDEFRTMAVEAHAADYADARKCWWRCNRELGTVDGEAWEKTPTVQKLHGSR